MIKWILCKLGLHKYKMSHFRLTSSMATVVKCDWCGQNLKDTSADDWEKRRDKILNTKLP